MAEEATGRRRLPRSLTPVLSVAVSLTALLTCGCAEDGAEHGAMRVCSESNATEARDWLDAVEVGDEARALRVAESLVPPSERNVPPRPEYESLFAENGVKAVFLSSPFNHWDFQSWSHALFFARLAASVGANGSDPVTSCFDAVTARVRAPDPDGPGLLWPYVIWQTGHGYCDRQAWVLCELAYQAGADAKIVYLRDPDTLISPHTIAQLRINRRAWVADPFSSVLMPDLTVAELAANPALAPAAWQAHPAWLRAITAAQLWIPAYPQDYCPRNQALYRKLSACLSAACPRFGEDPLRRLESVAADRGALPCALWHYPIRLLAWEIAAR